jgi:hypothetical protein
MIGKLTAVRAVAGHMLELQWDDGDRRRLDLHVVIHAGAILAPLRDEAAFSEAHLSADGWSVEWPCGIDFGAGQLRVWADAHEAAATPA